MGQILQNWRIPLSALFAVVIIIGAYLFARSVESPSSAQASTESALLQAIATKDSDGDGLSDWEEALYGTNPNITDSFNLGMTDGDAVSRGLVVPKAVADIPMATSSPLSLGADGLPSAPAEGTITAAFAKSFFSLYLSAKEANGGGDLSESQMNDVASQALSSLSSIIVAAPDFKSVKDLTVSGAGADALKEFAVSAEMILAKNRPNTTISEVDYLKNALLNDDATAIPHIASIAKAYRDSAVGLSALTVPTELAADDLALINAMMRISQIATDFTRANTDPLATILALKQYPEAVLALGNAFINIGKIYKTAGISLPSNVPGASFVNLMENVSAKQKAAAAKP